MICFTSFQSPSSGLVTFDASAWEDLEYLHTSSECRPAPLSASQIPSLLKVARSRHRLTLVAVQVQRFDQLCDVLVVELDPKPSPSERLPLERKCTVLRHPQGPSTCSSILDLEDVVELLDILLCALRQIGNRRCEHRAAETDLVLLLFLRDLRGGPNPSIGCACLLYFSTKPGSIETNPALVVEVPNVEYISI